MPGGARRAPPPLPPNGSVDSPPPLPSRNGPGPRTHHAAVDSTPPPLPSRPGAVSAPADDMYEDMNGGFPKIIDARPNKKVTSQALLPPVHNSNSNSMQQQNLMMEETYELPVSNTHADPHGFPAKLEQSTVQADEIQPTDEPGNDLYEMPECQEPVQDEVYEQADEVDLCIRPVPPPSKKPSGASIAPLSVHPATLQMGKMKLNNVSQESSSKTTATKSSKPQPPPKPENAQGMGGSSIVKALTQKLNERAKGIKSGSEKTEAKEIQSDDNSSAGSCSSQSGPQPHIAAKEVRPIHPPKFEGSSIPKNTPPPPQKPARQLTIDETETDLIYDEAVTETLHLYEWYHGQIDRNVAISRVKNIGQNGAFLIRESSQSSGSHRYTLVVLCNGKVHNLVIRERRDGNLALGQTEKPDEVHFCSLKDLVEHHRAHNVRLLREDELVKLSATPKRL